MCSTRDLLQIALHAFMAPSLPCAGKIGIFLFAAWAGSDGNGIIVGLVLCGIYCTIAGSSADLMQV